MVTTYKPDSSVICDRAAASRRPILTHLNADTTWLLRLPYGDDSARPPGRSYFNILIDPWLRGRQSDVAFWFSSQWHVIQSSVETIARLNDTLEASESLDDNSNIHSHTNFVDAVVVSHEFTDHCHKATLLELDPTVPVFATNKAAELIRSWGHFEQVVEPPPFSIQEPDWRKTLHRFLPGWIGISRIVTRDDSLYYHSAIMIAFDLEPKLLTHSHSGEGSAESVIYTPHGIQAQDLECLNDASPALSTLALMHGLHDVRITTKQLNLGAHNGLQAQRICRAKYWVSTHDEVKKARGFISPILFRKKWTLKHALEEERKRIDRGHTQSRALQVMDKVQFLELGSGQDVELR